MRRDVGGEKKWFFNNHKPPCINDLRFFCFFTTGQAIQKASGRHACSNGSPTSHITARVVHLDVDQVAERLHYMRGLPALLNPHCGDGLPPHDSPGLSS
jgi:hypothetical protein